MPSRHLALRLSFGCDAALTESIHLRIDRPNSAKHTGRMTPLSDQLRRAIAVSGISHNELARQTKIPQPTITRFVNGQDMRLSNADRVATCFKMSLRTSHPWLPSPFSRKTTPK